MALWFIPVLYAMRSEFYNSNVSNGLRLKV